jgi:squalene synthase HpnC
MTDSLNEGVSDRQINRQQASASNGRADDGGKIRIPLGQAEAHCRGIALRHYENFLVASVLLPKTMRQPFYNVYAFCRHADDLADESESPAIATTSLRRLRSELDRCFRGDYDSPLFVALADTIARFGLVQKPFDDLIDAFLQDQTKTRFDNFDELLHYCRRSADPVGRIVLRMAGADSAENVALSDSICTGLQLANHWQDIRRDFDAGRVYLPQDAMRAMGVDESMLADDHASDAVKKLVADQCRQARRFLADGLPLADRVPRWLASDIRLFVHGGLATLDAIAKCDHDTLRVRPKVSRWKQMRLTALAAIGRL